MSGAAKETILTHGGAVFRLRLEVARAETAVRIAARNLKAAKARLSAAEAEARSRGRDRG